MSSLRCACCPRDLELKENDHVRDDIENWRRNNWAFLICDQCYDRCCRNRDVQQTPLVSMDELKDNHQDAFARDALENKEEGDEKEMKGGASKKKAARPKKTKSKSKGKKKAASKSKAKK